MSALIEEVEFTHFHLFCGLGGGARGFNRGRAQVGNLRAKFRCLGGVDIDPACIRDFTRMAGVRGTVLDMFHREQFLDFFGRKPPEGWREATPADIQNAAGGERPNIVFLSAPCKGFSGLLSESKSTGPKYQALNRLTLRGIWLMLEAWADDPPELIIFENVPRIATRGRALLDRIGELLRHYGYAIAETEHDCGELGNLAQSRKRFLLVARHQAKVPCFLYQPPKRGLRGVGEILEKLPMPGAIQAGPMHSLPRLHWKTWVRLAFVEAGSDWRSLNKLRVVDGALADYLIVPENLYRGTLGVNRWDEPSGTVTGNARPLTGLFSVADPRQRAFERGYGVSEWTTPGAAVQGKSHPSNGAFSVADPRFHGHEFSQFGVRRWDEPSGTVTGQGSPGQGPISIADPRLGDVGKFNNCFRVVEWTQTSPAISGGTGPSAGGLGVADPRPPGGPFGKYAITRWSEAARAVIAGDDNGAYAVADPRPNWENRYGNLHVSCWRESSKTVIAGGKGVQGGWLSVADPRYGADKDYHSNIQHVTDWAEPARTITGATHTAGGALSVADPRILDRKKGDHYLTGGQYGVIPWDSPTGAISAAAQHDSGRFSVADPRLPAAADKLVCIIRALDGTWHRPFTTLELAALQSLIDPEDLFDLDGTSDHAKRERIGNAVPPYAAQAIADLMGETLLLAKTGETFVLSALPVWVQPVAVALSVSSGGAL